MELIRQDTDYAMRAMVYLAGMSGEQNVTTRVLARSQQIPTGFCYKILHKLVDAGLVASRFGRKGGFQLARRPASIRLIDIVTAVQGPVAVSPCVLNLKACPRRHRCPVSRKWRNLQETIVHFLRTTTMADIVKSRTHSNFKN